MGFVTNFVEPKSLVYWTILARLFLLSQVAEKFEKGSTQVIFCYLKVTSILKCNIAKAKWIFWDNIEW